MFDDILTTNYSIKDAESNSISEGKVLVVYTTELNCLFVFGNVRQVKQIVIPLWVHRVGLLASDLR